MKKILFINPPSPDHRKFIRNIDCCFESKGNYLYQPMDFLQLSGVFNTGKWDIKLIDAVASKYTSEYVIHRTLEFNPDIIVLAMGDSNWKHDLSFLKELTGEVDQKYILGLGDSFADEPPLNDVSGHIDGIITSPWDIDPSIFELTLSRKWKSIKNLPGIISLKNPQRLPISKKPSRRSIATPRHDLFLHKRYRWPFARHFKYTTVYTAWGCPQSCNYCPLSISSFLYRSSDEIIYELKKIKALGIKEVYFADRSFGAPIKNIKQILQAMIENNFKISWSSYFHPNMYDHELLELMKASGCHTIIVGVESHDLAILEQYSRVINNSKLNLLIEHAKKIGIGICADFILGFRGQTEEDVLKTIDYSIKQNFDYASFNILTPLPGTEWKAEAIIDGKMTIDGHHFDTLGKDAVLSSNCLSSYELIRLRNLAVRKFYIRPSYLLKRLLNISSLTHLIIQLLEMKSIIGKSKN